MSDIANSAGIRIVLFTQAHLPGLIETLRDGESRRFTPVPEPLPTGFAETWLRGYEEGREDGTREAFAIVDQRDRFLGSAVAPSIDVQAGTIELGYMIHPAARGRGVATRTLELLTEWGFSQMRAVRLQLSIGAANEVSKKVALRNRYTYEGTLRSVYLKPDVREDSEVWSRLSTDP